MSEQEILNLTERELSKLNFRVRDMIISYRVYDMKHASESAKNKIIDDINYYIKNNTSKVRHGKRPPALSDMGIWKQDMRRSLREVN